MYAVKNRNQELFQHDGMMRKGKMKPKYDLEDYIYDVESRSLEPSADPEDVYAQLQQKEQDLMLAAELGKALLEKNEELSRQNERLAEEYSQKLEVIEQDRHLLRRKLVSTQAECDTRLLELQADLRDLQAALNERDNALRNTEKEKAVLISELSEQNQRLTNQIKESAKNEEQLSLQLQGLRDQYSLRKSSLQDHQTSLDVLRDEILFMSEKKLELERRVQMLQDQRDNLSSALEEATDRVLLLERETREQQIQLQVSHRELEELRSANGSLGDRLEAMGVTPPGSSGGHRSLLSEMECDDQLLTSLPQGDDLHQLKVEVVSVYDRVRAICQSLKHRANHSDSSIRPDITVHQVKVGLLTTIINELSDLINEIGGGDYSTSSVSVTDLEIDLHRAQEAVDRMTKEIDAKSEELKRRNETIVDLSSKLNIKEAELLGAVEERDRARADLKDAGAGGLARDEMVRKAWEVRDGAVARKNATQLELAKTRIDMLQANSQLMEAIQQKVELSQQLEQWQMDMQALLDEQMRLKLGNPDQTAQSQSSGASTPSSLSNPAKRPSRKLFGIFQR
ncbi:bicaudal D-related protein homolog [Nilaparvata lugens]|uniref:bicaudal D-related protein homolog n=1 Tax=Nilaparvata lugens TaxID=108931 RepID=UPI00193E6BA9|nr:bicaudal D-related protein homolog [Nilaparvata lugens]